MKRKISIVLALILALTLAVPSLAAEPDPVQPVESSEPVEEPSGPMDEPSEPVPESPAPPEESESPLVPDAPFEPESTLPLELPDAAGPQETDALAEDVEINVIVPASGQVILNPYGVAVESDHGVSREQIVGETMAITNNSTVPVSVQASAVGSASGLSTLGFASQPPANMGEKEVFLYAEFQPGNGAWSGTYSGADNQILVPGQLSEPKTVLALDVNSGGMFRLFGAASMYPEDPWCSDDSISVTFTFTFEALDGIPALNTDTGSDSAGETEGKLDGEPSDDPVEAPTEALPQEPTEEPSEEPSGNPEPAPEPSPEEPTEPPTDTPDIGQQPDAGTSPEPSLPEESSDPAGELTEGETQGEEADQNSVPPDEEEQMETNGQTDSGRSQTGIL